MIARVVGGLVGWRERERRSSGRGRARVQNDLSPDSRAGQLLTAVAVESGAEGPE